MRDALRLAVEKLPQPIRTRARNAFQGFDRARKLLEIDREMASFLAITSEEEAVAALFRSLQIRKYPDSDKLNLYKHELKSALAPFLSAVLKSLVAGGQSLNLRVTIDMSAPSLEVQIPLRQFGIVLTDTEEHCLQLVEPLGIVGTKEGLANPADFFDAHIAEVARDANVKDIRRFVRDQANNRNKILYASDSSLPRSKATEADIETRQKRADTALLLSIAVLQTPGHQGMALQCLAAFLKMVRKASDDAMTPRMI